MKCKTQDGRPMVNIKANERGFNVLFFFIQICRDKRTIVRISEDKLQNGSQTRITGKKQKSDT